MYVFCNNYQGKLLRRIKRNGNSTARGVLYSFSPKANTFAQRPHPRRIRPTLYAQANALAYRPIRSPNALALNHFRPRPPPDNFAHAHRPERSRISQPGASFFSHSRFMTPSCETKYRGQSP
jgi:hypothetical protein